MNENKYAEAFVVSLSNHEQPFDMLRANGWKSIFIFIVMTRSEGLAMTV